MIKGNMWHTARTKQHPWQSILLVLALLGLAGCNLPTQATEPIFIPPASSPIALIPSPTPEPLFELGGLVEVADGGFAYPQVLSLKNQPGSFDVLQQDGQVSLSSPNQDLLMSLTSEETDTGEDAQDCLERVLLGMAQDIDQFIPSKPSLQLLSERDALRVDFSGKLFEQPISGSLLVTTPQDGRCFTGIGMAVGSGAESHWQGQGQPLFDALLATLRFFEIERTSACPLSSDPNYGFSLEAPIRVGNTNLYDGAAREEAYLQTLRGPNGESVRYERLDALMLADQSILDVYQVSYDGLDNPVTLYLDMYSYEMLLLPQGFTCAEPFPLEAP